ncbi:MAG: hypothetical protein QUV20_09660 [Oceanibaculum nanhaiense]|uniref:hypothetical protein n=1 Tax=Oceanibaculum nanhaiense TaxID=1909734 RepID=UPI0025A3FE95|nr:hypothetical protein [Oceanibaculum nanhaiense]MDM7946581.1 hypothetical protein [Oceanibaculum nanhaiense]
MHPDSQGPAILHWLQDGAIGRAMRESLWLFPAVEIVHILGFALLIGTIVALDLRILGWGKTLLPVGKLGALTLPLSIAGFTLALPSGLLLLTTEAAHVGVNPAFLAKMGLIFLAGLNALLLHRGAWRSVAAWPADAPPSAAKGAAIASLFLWLGVLIAGRMIAYL